MMRLSPVLFSIYTNEIPCNNPILTMVKVADDMAPVDELSHSQYYLQIESLTC